MPAGFRFLLSKAMHELVTYPSKIRSRFFGRAEYLASGQPSHLVAVTNPSPENKPHAARAKLNRERMTMVRVCIGTLRTQIPLSSFDYVKQADRPIKQRAVLA
jgi:hypothetical protein